MSPWRSDEPCIARQAIAKQSAERGSLKTEQGVSERCACRIVGLAQSVQQYRLMPRNDEAAVKRMKEMASENRRDASRPHTVSFGPVEHGLAGFTETRESSSDSALRRQVRIAVPAPLFYRC